MLAMLPEEKANQMKTKTTLLIGAIGLTIANTLGAQDRPAAPQVQPDIVLKASADAEAVGDDVYGSAEEQTIRVSTVGKSPARFAVGLQNDDDEIDSRILFRASRGDRNFDVRYAIGDRNVTAAVVRGMPIPLAAGEGVRILASASATRATLDRPARTGLRFAARSGELSDNAAPFGLKKPARRG